MRPFCHTDQACRQTKSVKRKLGILPRVTHPEGTIFVQGLKYVSAWSVPRQGICNVGLCRVRPWPSGFSAPEIKGTRGVGWEKNPADEILDRLARSMAGIGGHCRHR